MKGRISDQFIQQFQDWAAKSHPEKTIAQLTSRELEDAARQLGISLREVHAAIDQVGKESETLRHQTSFGKPEGCDSKQSVPAGQWLLDESEGAVEKGPVKNPAKLGLSIEDVADIEEHGLTMEQVASMVDKLQKPPRFVDLVKAATEADGIVTLEDVDLLAEQFKGSTVIPGKLTPMSGAASRMFGFLERFLSGALKEGDEAKVQTFIDGLDAKKEGPKFPFLEQLDSILQQEKRSLEKLIEDGAQKEIVEYTMEPKGLGFRGKPKAVIPFHQQEGRPVMPLEEHMKEAVAYGGSKLHITISPEHKGLMDEALIEIRRANPDLAQVEVEFSTQHSSTDSVAIDAKTKEIVRDMKEGRVVFFPAGHGSLIKNVGDVHRPVVLRNVDNTPRPKQAQEQVEKYHQAFAVLLGRIKELVSTALRQIKDESITEPELDDIVAQLLEMKLHLLGDLERYAEAPFAEKKVIAQEMLNRPVKIVGVVENQGEPGGGPFVIVSGNNRFVSIVEKDEISPDQKQMMKDGAFFNPVDILADPTNHEGKPFDLDAFVNPDRYFIVTKPYAGRDVVRMEHPGLWNGAMDGWNALFVTLPIETFAPVKEVNDILRPSHQDG